MIVCGNRLLAAVRSWLPIDEGSAGSQLLISSHGNFALYPAMFLRSESGTASQLIVKISWKDVLLIPPFWKFCCIPDLLRYKKWGRGDKNLGESAPSHCCELSDWVVERLLLFSMAQALCWRWGQERSVVCFLPPAWWSKRNNLFLFSNLQWGEQKQITSDPLHCSAVFLKGFVRSEAHSQLIITPEAFQHPSTASLRYRKVPRDQSPTSGWSLDQLWGSYKLSAAIYPWSAHSLVINVKQGYAHPLNGFAAKIVASLVSSFITEAGLQWSKFLPIESKTSWSPLPFPVVVHLGIF